ncbi:MAG: alpha,alpha-trehalase, partial [Microcoleus sp. SIO2G3]|nr:alpha,alpha-trehalase [Microcoleus sp. SIO2G3]
MTSSVDTFPSIDQIQAVRTYIKETWKTLTRSQEHILEAARDPKFHGEIDRCPVYVSPQEDRDAIEAHLQQILSPEEWSQIDLRTLPAEVGTIEQHGLLYLPHDYVVPGGR